MNSKQSVKILTEKAAREDAMSDLREKEHNESPDDARPLLAHEIHSIRASAIREAAKLLCDHKNTTPRTGLGDVCDVCGEILVVT